MLPSRQEIAPNLSDDFMCFFLWTDVFEPQLNSRTELGRRAAREESLQELQHDATILSKIVAKDGSTRV